MDSAHGLPASSGPVAASPGDPATAWLDELLVAAEHLKAPDHFPAAQGVFDAIRRILSAVRNLKEPQVLKDLWEILVHTGIIVQNNENKTPEVRGLVSELLDQIQDEVDKLLSKQAGFEQRHQLLDSTTSSLRKYYNLLVDLQKKFTTGPNTIQMNIYGGTGGAGGAGKFGGPGGIGQGSAFNIEAPYATFNMSERYESLKQSNIILNYFQTDPANHS
ncbi:NB-ARC domain-containing protein [Mycena chlorophos]|uniref:NB-ARC domain-containing protein n=1 Tax=Mycena chlorophos TaxID=658473 RepID=A0A8H6VVC1_MYCCL|nr:NB-ARC domain-containing protein [Mycena chlorophos]